MEVASKARISFERVKRGDEMNWLRLGVAVGSGCVAFLAGAATFTWSGGGGDSNWSNGGNWSGGTAPATDGSALLQFVGEQGLTPSNDFAADTVFDGISLQNTGDAGKSKAFSLKGNRIILNGNIGSATVQDTFKISDTIAIPMILNGNRTIHANRSGTGVRTITISGVISEGGGSYGVTKTGNSELKLTGANTYSGQTIVNGGFLFFNTIKNVGGGASALGAPTTVEAGTIKVTASATMRYTGPTAATDRNLDISSGATLTFYNDTSGATLTLNGDVPGVGNLTFRGNNNFTVNGKISGNDVTRTDNGTITFNCNDNDFTGLVHIKHGTFTVEMLADQGEISPLGKGNSIRFGQTAYQTTGRLLFNGPEGGSCNRDITIDTYTGLHGARIENGVAGQTLILSGTASVKLPTGAAATMMAPLFLAGRGDGVMSGTINQRIGVIKEGAGTWALVGNNQYEGGTVVSNGTLLINSATKAQSSVTVEANGVLSGSGTINGTVNIKGGTVNPGIDGSGTLILADSGGSALTLNDALVKFTLGEVAASCNSANIAGTLVLNGESIIALDTPLNGAPAGSYTLMTYGAKTGEGTIRLDRSYPNAMLVDTGSALELVV